MDSINETDGSILFRLVRAFFFRDETHEGVVCRAGKKFVFLELDKNLENVILNRLPEGLKEKEWETIWPGGPCHYQVGRWHS